jgi:hypothetical protein
MNVNAGSNRFEIPLFDKWVVKVVEIVNDRDAIVMLQQGLNEMRAYKSGASCNQNIHLAKATNLGRNEAECKEEGDRILLNSVLYPLVAEAKKGVARIQVPPKAPKITEGSTGRNELTQEGPDVDDARGVHMLMSRAIPAKRDPLIVPLVGLLLAFSVISLIVQLLIAFS